MTATDPTNTSNHDELASAFDPTKMETRWAKRWESLGVAAPQGDGDAYCIMLPPPNVTGSLHMGHGFQQTLMDVLTRYHIMMGRKTLWQGGTDHAGIATQMVVERQLDALGQRRHDLGRDAFIDKVWDWKKQSGAVITSQIRRIGALVDWKRERFTMDDQLSRATRTAFIRLHQDGLIYRGKRLVNWDPKLQTAISDLEVENEERNGHMWHCRYPIAGSDAALVIATTRPETMLGDTAVAVHPDDERYQHLIGQKIDLPLCDRQIPIIADTYVDPEFGTGCVKITPAHDFNDYDVGKRNDLPMINILTVDAHINDAAPKAYQGLTREAARKQVVKDLDALGLLEKVDDHRIQAPIGTRTGVVIEPMLTDQWFIKMEGLAKPALEAVRDSKTHFIPDNWKKTYEQWLDNIQDWCISRQLWWGHRIPAWYNNAGNVYVGDSESDVRAANSLDDAVTLTQDDDVLDTWFTSALWPFATLGWPDETPDLSTFYPTQVLVTGFDIIFFWVARMMMMGLYFVKDVPFREVYITGLIRDAQGKKMSKSKGNVLDPLDLIHGISLDQLLEKRTAHLMQPEMKAKIEKATRKEFPDGIPAFGTDALRFTYCALATNGRDINFDLNRVEGYRHFCNKLWNAARFVFMQTEGGAHDGGKPASMGAIDHWVLLELQRTIDDVHRHMTHYRFDLMATTLYEFVWDCYCDWYLEFAKASQTPATKHTLLFVLDKLLQLIHPLMPFITEEISQELDKRLGRQNDTLLATRFPARDEVEADSASHAEIEQLRRIITQIRTIRAEMHISPAKAIAVNLVCENPETHARLTELDLFIQQVAKVDTLTWHTTRERLPEAAIAVVDDVEVQIPLAGNIDIDAEKARLQKSIDKWLGEQERLQKKLGNERFVSNAPEAVVAQEQDKLANATQQVDALTRQREALKKLS